MRAKTSADQSGDLLRVLGGGNDADAHEAKAALQPPFQVGGGSIDRLDTNPQDTATPCFAQPLVHPQPRNPKPIRGLALGQTFDFASPRQTNQKLFLCIDLADLYVARHRSSFSESLVLGS